MTAAITTVVAAVLGSVGAYFTWRSSSIRQRRLAEADVAKEEGLREIRKDEIRRAVYENNDEELNRIVQKLMED